MRNPCAGILCLVVSLGVVCGCAWGQERLCDIGYCVLEPGEFRFFGSATHVWQGAWGGVDTKNADRMAGLYDLDLYYLVSAEADEEGQGDYTMVGLSSQAHFGSGTGRSKVHTFFDINQVAKGDMDLYVDKAFVRFTMERRAFTFDVGKVDMVDYFDQSAVANQFRTQFLAKPFKNNPAIPLPMKGLGAVGQWAISDAWYVRAGIGDAQSNKRETGLRTTFGGEDHFVSLGEAGLRTEALGRRGTYRATVWYQPQDKAYLDGSGRVKRDDVGFGLSFDQHITEKATLFFRYGWADGQVNRIEDFFSFGGDIKGPLEGRPGDVWGIAYGVGLRSEEGLAAGQERQIDLMETYYRVRVSEHLAVSPHVQVVMDPGGRTGESPATVFGVRCRYSF